VGLAAALHLKELADLFTGFFGYDLLGADAHGRSLAELREQARSLDARQRDRAFDALLRRGEDIRGYAIYSAPDVRPAFQRQAIEALGDDGP